jgi:hypothetical protein
MADAEGIGYAAGTFRQGKKMNRIEQVGFPDSVFAYNAIDI